MAHDPHGTIASVRNKLAGKAKGTFLCHLDADDELAPGYLDAMRAAAETLYEPLRATLCGCPEHGGLQLGPCPCCGWEKLTRYSPALLVPSVQYVHSNGREEKPCIPNRPLRPLVEINRAVIGSLVPRALFHEVGGFKEGCEPWEDWELWLRCERAGANLIEVPGAIYRAHVREGSAHRPTDPKEQARLTDLYWRIRREHEAALRSVPPEV